MLGMFRQSRNRERVQNPIPTESLESSESEDEQSTELESEELEEDEEEDWVTWIKRTTGIAEDQLRKMKLDDWVCAQRRLKWRFAGHVARRSDERWATTLTRWTPQIGYRNRGHPNKRWRTDLDAFFKHKYGAQSGFWQAAACDRQSLLPDGGQQRQTAARLCQAARALKGPIVSCMKPEGGSPG
eukprot:10556031-Karenia_brevis.AAC.1